MTTELKATEELFQQALKAYGSFEIARSNAERVSMRQGFEWTPGGINAMQQLNRLLPGALGEEKA